MGRWQVYVLWGKPEHPRSRCRTGNPRLCVYPHGRYQDSDGRVVWRRYAVRRNHWQPAVSAERCWRWNERGIPFISSLLSKRKHWNHDFCRWLFRARWFAGGKGLDEFRQSMLADDRLRSIDDYLSAADVFPGVGLKGGVCYFLWDRDNPRAVPRHHSFQGLACLNGQSPTSSRGRGCVYPLQ